MTARRLPETWDQRYARAAEIALIAMGRNPRPAKAADGTVVDKWNADLDPLAYVELTDLIYRYGNRPLPHPGDGR